MHRATTHGESMYHRLTFVILGLVLVSLQVATGQTQTTEAGNPPALPEGPVINRLDRFGGAARSYALGSGGYGTLGGQAKYHSYLVDENPFLVDPISQFANPAWMDNYSNMVGAIIDHGGVMGVNLRMNKSMTIGAVLGTHWSPITEGGLYEFAHPGSSTPSYPELHYNTMQLQGSVKSGGVTYGFGLVFSHYSNSSENSAVTPTSKGDSSGSDLGFLAGMIIDMGRKAKLDIGATVMFPGYGVEIENNNAKTTASYHHMIMTLDGRLLYTASDAWTLVPFLKARFVNGSYKFTSPNVDLTEEQPTNLSLDLGFGVNVTAGRFLLVGGPSIGYYSASIPELQDANGRVTNQAWTHGQIILPRWNLGAEWYATDWLIARMGYCSMSSWETWSYDKSKRTQTVFNDYMDAGLRFGIGMRFGGFGIDAVVSDVALRDGLKNIGNGTATFGFMSASYAW